jgi:probable F420-dependent oxidoreductase
VKFGIGMFATEHSAGPVEVARAVEDRGFDSYWVSEHSHIPLASPPPFEGFDPALYASMLDPFVALAAAATVTNRIKLGMAICLVIQRDPINCAKAVASLDRVSNGRFLFGIGAGWNHEEMRDHGTDPDTRFRLMRERVEAMQALWTQPQPEYHGRMVQFDALRQSPKPTQTPHPPVLIAGAGPGVLRRVVRYGDGWLPVVVPDMPDEMKGKMTSLAEFKSLMPELAAMAQAAGKPKPEVSVSGAGSDPKMLEAFQELGVDRVILRVEPVGFDEVERTLDQYRELVASVGGTLDT